MTKTEVFYVIENDGAGSAYLRWFLTKEGAKCFEENIEEGFGESTITSVETFIGSDIYNKAKEASEYLKEIFEG